MHRRADQRRADPHVVDGPGAQGQHEREDVPHVLGASIPGSPGVEPQQDREGQHEERPLPVGEHEDGGGDAERERAPASVTTRAKWRLGCASGVVRHTHQLPGQHQGGGGGQRLGGPEVAGPEHRARRGHEEQRRNERRAPELRRRRAQPCHGDADNQSAREQMHGGEREKPAGPTEPRGGDAGIEPIGGVTQFACLVESEVVPLHVEDLCHRGAPVERVREIRGGLHVHEGKRAHQPGGAHGEREHRDQRRDKPRGAGWRADRAGAARAHPSTPKRESLRCKVEGSIPKTSAARVLLPCSACNTHMM